MSREKVRAGLWALAISVVSINTRTMAFARDEWNVRTETRTVLRSTETELLLDATLDGYEGDQRVFSRTWNERVPRDHL